MSKRNRRYQLPRNWIVLPIIIYTVLIIVTFIAISMSTVIFSEYTTNLKAKAETEAAFSYAELYENASEDQLDNLYSEISSKYEFFIADKDWNVLYPSGSQMTLVIPEEENELEPLNASFVTNIPGFDKMPFDPDSLRIIVADNARYCADKDTSFFDIEDNSISPKSFEILNDQDLLTSIFNNGSVPVPYWTVFEVKEGKELIAFKTHIDIHLTDVIYIGSFALLSAVISGIIFILLLINVIRTHINNRKMRNIVFRDHVTGNRNWFWFALKSKEILRKRRNNVQYAIVSLAFVRYRNYVLCHSVEAGEKKLRDIWKTISSSLDKNEICAHSALANFPILIKAATAADANARVDRIIKSLSVLSGDHDFKFQAGVCMIDPKIRKDADIDLLYNNASSARATLETTDDTGIAFFDNKLVEDEKWIDLVTERQRDALEKEEFKVYYQPKFDPRTNELKGCEALIRWVSDDMGFVTPGQFIPIFEKSGFITEIDHYMLSHVARDQKSWLDEGRKCVPVSVNVSRAHFAETNLAEQIKEIIDREGAPHNLIEIELTESAFFDDTKQMLKTIKKLKSYGFLVSMDDFGSGYSSLNSLKDMPLDILKLDAGFFGGDKHNERAEIVVAETLQLAKKLNMTTVAEGVDYQSQVDFLAAEGCDMIQGYFYSKPMPKEEYALKLEKKAVVTPEVTKEDDSVKENSAPDAPSKTEEDQAEPVPAPQEPDDTDGGGDNGQE